MNEESSNEIGIDPSILHLVKEALDTGIIDIGDLRSLGAKEIEGFSYIKETKKTDPFYIAKYPVTQELYESVMEKNPSKFKGAKRPVENVNIFEAIAFCNMLSEKEGLRPCFSDDVENHKIYIDLEADGYRLPTHEEWKVAAKGFSDFEYAGSDNLDEVAWFKENSNGETHNVGEKKPNEFGLYDMCGNVWEFCWEFDKKEDCTRVLICGGSWKSKDNFCLLSNHAWKDMYTVSDTIGFRLVRSNVNADSTGNDDDELSSHQTTVKLGDIAEITMPAKVELNENDILVNRMSRNVCKFSDDSEIEKVKKGGAYCVRPKDGYGDAILNALKTEEFKAWAKTKAAPLSIPMEALAEYEITVSVSGASADSTDDDDEDEDISIIQEKELKEYIKPEELEPTPYSIAFFSDKSCLSRCDSEGNVEHLMDCNLGVEYNECGIISTKNIKKILKTFAPKLDDKASVNISLDFRSLTNFKIIETIAKELDINIFRFYVNAESLCLSNFQNDCEKENNVLVFNFAKNYLKVTAVSICSDLFETEKDFALNYEALDECKFDFQSFDDFTPDEILIYGDQNLIGKYYNALKIKFNKDAVFVENPIEKISSGSVIAVFSALGIGNILFVPIISTNIAFKSENKIIPLKYDKKFSIPCKKEFDTLEINSNGKIEVIEQLLFNFKVAHEEVIDIYKASSDKDYLLNFEINANFRPTLYHQK